MRKLVVVDSDPSNCHLLGEIASSRGWTMAGCARGVTEGLALLARTRPDCLIADFWFGEGETGLDLIARAKALLPDLHTVIFTGWDLRDVAAFPGGRQPETMLRKPGSTQALMDLLATISGAGAADAMRVAS